MPTVYFLYKCAILVSHNIDKFTLTYWHSWAPMAKSIDWIDTDNRLTAKKLRLDRCSSEEKILASGSILVSVRNRIFSPMIDTIGQTLKFLTDGSIPLV